MGLLWCRGPVGYIGAVAAFYTGLYIEMSPCGALVLEFTCELQEGSATADPAYHMIIYILLSTFVVSQLAPQLSGHGSQHGQFCQLLLQLA